MVNEEEIKENEFAYNVYVVMKEEIRKARKQAKQELAKEIFKDLEADCCVIKDKFYKKVKDKWLS